VEREEIESERPTVTIERDALLGLIDQTVAQPASLAHTVSRDQLRSRAVTVNETPTAERQAVEPDFDVEPLDMDLSPTLSPWLVTAVLALLLVVFIAVARLQ
jgi:hypothetical protein